MKLPNFTYHFALREGSLRRQAYRALLPAVIRRKFPAARSFPYEVYSYSGEATVPEQVRSIRSFLRFVGRPTKLTIVSDGTHSSKAIARLKSIDPVIAVCQAEKYLPAHVPCKFATYLKNHPLGKQLALIMSLPGDGAALYMDSDVLFFPGAATMIEDAPPGHSPALYLSDCQNGSADSRLFHTPEETRNPVNCGFMIVFRPLDWSLAIERFLELEGSPEFFTNQTLIHLVMHANGAHPLDRARYVLQLDDQCTYRDRYAGPGIVLRHYVNPVRHKFWNAA